MQEPRPVLIAGEWRPADASGTFHAWSPATGAALSEVYPISRRSDLEAALAAGAEAARELALRSDADRAAFLDRYAERVEARKDEIVAAAHAETALPVSPRLADGEFPRTTGQLRQAAAAARDASWRQATIDHATGVRSMLEPLGAPVVVFGPNNFPLAFSAISGGDFAAAIAAGNPVIAKAHPAHPRTTRLFAEEARAALDDVGLPAATVQLLYHFSIEDGLWLAGRHEVGAIGYTGSQPAGLALKRAADAAGVPIYLELSSINPVFILPGALEERGEEIAKEFVGSALMAAGQFCTNPGVVVMLDGDQADAFIERVRRAFAEAAPSPLLAENVARGLEESVNALRAAGAELITGGARAAGGGFRFENTLLVVSGERFLADASLQREAFGNASLIVRAASEDEMVAIAASFEGNLTGAIYSHTGGGGDDGLADRVAAPLRARVGRLLNDKMPTGVAVCPAMQHGGPFPSTGHPGFTSVGIPASLRRFAALRAYDNVRPHRLPPLLRDENPASAWRLVDGEWTRS